jgi:hypothetical protein
MKVAVPAGPSGRAAAPASSAASTARGELKGIVAGVPQSGERDARPQGPAAAPARPYLDAFTSLDVQKAQTSFKGTVAWRRPPSRASRVRGDATVDDFRATSPLGGRATPRRGLALRARRASGPPLLNWKSLSLRGIDVALVPGAPAAGAVAETALSDFFARVVLDEEGRLNLQQVARPGDAASAPAARRARRRAAGPRRRPPRRRRRRRGARPRRSSTSGRSRSSTAGSRSTTASSSPTTAPT